MPICARVKRSLGVVSVEESVVVGWFVVEGVLSVVVAVPLGYVGAARAPTELTGGAAVFGVVVAAARSLARPGRLCACFARTRAAGRRGRFALWIARCPCEGGHLRSLLQAVSPAGAELTVSRSAERVSSSVESRG